MSDGKKMSVLLGSVLGIAVIVVLTAFALKLIFQHDETPAAKPAVEVTQATTPAPQPAPVAQPTNAAQVTSVRPHYVEKSIPKRDCREVRHVVYTQEESQAPGAGAVVGGVTGGLLGTQVGGGHGRLLATAAGAAIGALAGNSVQNNMNKPEAHEVYSTACSTHYIKTTVQKGFEVSYTYNGQPGVVIMDDAPMIGSALPIPLK